MANLKEIRKRISSVKNTQKITKALKLVSAAKLNRAQREITRLKPYAEKQQALLKDLISELGSAEPSPLFEVRAEVKKIAVFVLTSDRGMCGGFNSNLLKKLTNFISENKDAQVSCFPIGRRASQYVKKQGYTMGEDFGDIIGPDLDQKVAQIKQRLVSGFLGGEFDQVIVIYNRFVNALTQTPGQKTFLPLTATERKEEDPVQERLYEPNQKSILDFMVPKTLETQIRQSILESIAGEHAARMNAMGSATKNAAEMITNLTLALNRARQAAITTELMEIISGAEALK
jgi:F-type H+-transporting ATPase subunit gamma